MDDRTKERVRKLLALASNNPSIEEAAVAFARAQEIATSAGLDLDDLSAEEPIEPPPRSVEAMREDMIDTCGKTIAWKYTIAVAAARANSCGVFIDRNRGGLACYGQPSDIDTVKYLYHAIVSQVETMARDAVKAYAASPDADPRWDESPRSYGRSWRMGCADAIAQRLPSPMAVVNKAKASFGGAVATMAARASGGSVALARIDRAADLVVRIAFAREEFSKKLGLKKGSGFTAARSRGGYAAGRTAGASVNLGNSGRALKGGR